MNNNMKLIQDYHNIRANIFNHIGFVPTDRVEIEDLTNFYWMSEPQFLNLSRTKDGVLNRHNYYFYESIVNGFGNKTLYEGVDFSGIICYDDGIRSYKIVLVDNSKRIYEQPIQ